MDDRVDEGPVAGGPGPIPRPQDDAPHPTDRRVVIYVQEGQLLVLFPKNDENRVQEIEEFRQVVHEHKPFSVWGISAPDSEYVWHPHLHRLGQRRGIHERMDEQPDCHVCTQDHLDDVVYPHGSLELQRLLVGHVMLEKGDARQVAHRQGHQGLPIEQVVVFWQELHAVAADEPLVESPAKTLRSPHWRWPYLQGVIGESRSRRRLGRSGVLAVDGNLAADNVAALAPDLVGWTYQTAAKYYEYQPAATKNTTAATDRLPRRGYAANRIYLTDQQFVKGAIGRARWRDALAAERSQGNADSNYRLCLTVRICTSTSYWGPNCSSLSLGRTPGRNPSGAA
eukprot:scaffold45566_cov34-Prasinocladus_malaysianus.AAC.2